MYNIKNIQVECPKSVTAMGGFCNDTIERTHPGFFIMGHKKQKVYHYGENIGNCIFIEDLGKSKSGKRIAKFKCKCGIIFIAQIFNVKSGHTNSCGCLRDKKVAEINASHGMSKHLLYYRWNAMRNRCLNKKLKRYKDWGGRGIKIYKPWINNFKAFYDYVTNLPGYNIELTLDRIDNDGNYEPGNLRWTTMKVQNNNKRRNKN